jgi:hypothetical protein
LLRFYREIFSLNPKMWPCLEVLKKRIRKTAYEISKDHEYLLKFMQRLVLYNNSIPPDIVLFSPQFDQRVKLLWSLRNNPESYLNRLPAEIFEMVLVWVEGWNLDMMRVGKSQPLPPAICDLVEWKEKWGLTSWKPMVAFAELFLELDVLNKK